MLDRWYNPFVHEQVEDRIYRIGQKKNVEIRYFDTAGTIDEGMKRSSFDAYILVFCCQYDFYSLHFFCSVMR